MPVSTTIEIVGVKQAINDLRKIDPQLQKDFKTDATAIAQPAINAGKAVYQSVPISNFAKDWNNMILSVCLANNLSEYASFSRSPEAKP